MLNGMIICSLDSGILLYSDTYTSSTTSYFGINNNKFGNEIIQLSSTLFAIYKSISSSSCTVDNVNDNNIKLNYIHQEDVILHFYENSSSLLSYLIIISISNDFGIKESQYLLKIISNIFERSDIYSSALSSSLSSSLLLSPRSSSLKSMKGELIKAYITFLENNYNYISNINSNSNDNDNNKINITILIDTNDVILKYIKTNNNDNNDYIDNNKLRLADTVFHQLTDDSIKVHDYQLQEWKGTTNYYYLYVNFI